MSTANSEGDISEVDQITLPLPMSTDTVNMIKL